MDALCGVTKRTQRRVDIEREIRTEELALLLDIRAVALTSTWLARSRLLDGRRFRHRGCVQVVSQVDEAALDRDHSMLCRALDVANVEALTRGPALGRDLVGENPGNSADELCTLGGLPRSREGQEQPRSRRIVRV